MKNIRMLGTTLIIVMIILMGLSIAMIASVSFPRGYKEFKNNYYFVIRQFVWFGVGTGIFFFTSRFKYTWYKKIKLHLYILGLGFLVAVLFSREVNGATRWFSFSGFNMQPSEMAKLIIIIYLAGIIDFCEKRKIRPEKLGFFLRLLIPLLVYIILIIAEKAFSSTVQITLIGMSMIFVSGVNIIQFLTTCLIIGGAGIISVMSTPYRMKRFMGFKSSELSYQVEQSLIAIGSGKLIGKFYGNGLQKFFYLPEIHTDYIFSGYAEEMGFIGSIILILIYIILLLVILITLAEKKDRYAKYILTGIFVMFSSQILGNIAVVLNIVPSTGIPLPLLSYGGSTTIVTMAALGIVYNIIKSLYIEKEQERLKEEEIVQEN